LNAVECHSDIFRNCASSAAWQNIEHEVEQARRRLGGARREAQPRLPWSPPKTRSIKCGEWQRGEISDSRQSG